MRFYDIALGVFILNLVIFFVGSTQIFGNVGVASQIDPFDSQGAFNASASSINKKVVGEDASLIDVAVLQLESVGIFVSTMVSIPVSFYFILLASGVPSGFANILLALTVFVYVIGIVQIMLGRGFKGNE
jgi:hypothetical protein